MTSLHLTAREYGQRPSDLIDPLWETLYLAGLRWQFDVAVATIGTQEMLDRANTEQVEENRGGRPLIDMTEPGRPKPKWFPSDYKKRTDAEIDASIAQFAFKYRDDVAFGRSVAPGTVGEQPGV